MKTNKTHITERSAVAVLMSWMREIIELNHLDLGLPNVETSGLDNKFPDLEVYASRRSNDVLCSFEAKRPDFDVFDNEEFLKEPARLKAVRRKAPFFALLNFRKLVWYDTAKVNQMLDEQQQIVQTYTLSDLSSLDDLETTRNRERIKRNLEDFLIKLYSIHTGKEPPPQIPVDELLINKLQEKIALLTYYYSRIIEEKYLEDKEFGHRLGKWFFDQNWNFNHEPEDFVKAARQASLLLVNKILFYDTLQTKRPNDLDPLEIPLGLTKGSMLQNHLQGYFDMALQIDYESVFNTDFVDELAFPDSREVIEEIKKLVSLLGRYNLAELGFDIIGRIFERLIPPEERHNFGQYFTSSDVVDLILKFCLKHESDKTLDPSCGSGTFLVRAYQHKKLMNRNLTHEQILETIWGNDIAKFPASLSIINLAINDLSVDHNYPNILREDFFNIQVGNDGIDLEAWRNRTAQTLSGKERQLVYPKQFDVIVGNPPYTRQEEIAELAPEDTAYKENLIDNAVKVGGQKIANIGKRAGIHAFFFVHGWKFLKEGGRFGFIVFSSWLDSKYGVGLQEFFLKNYKIVAIIESKVERWFAEADVNTCIVILEKCADQKGRDNNFARFVYLKKPLRNFIPPTSDIKEDEIKRQHAIEDFCDTILTHRKIYENEDFRVYPISQTELWDEGFDVEENKFEGANWGKYLRAPDILFEIIEKCKNDLICLRDVARPRFGIKTGANEFFYLSGAKVQKHKLEKEYLQPVIFSLKEVQGYLLKPEKLSHFAIVTDASKSDLKDTFLLKYINSGEKKGFNNRPTCAQRGKENWYILAKDWKYAPLIFPSKIGERMPVFLNDGVFEDKKLYGIIPNEGIDTSLLAAILNSTLTRFFIEFSCRQLTGAQAIADVDVIVVKKLLIPDIRSIDKNLRVRLKETFSRLAKSPAESVFVELFPTLNDADFARVKPDRLELDKIVIQDILGLSEAEHLEIYKAVVDLVRSRLDKAKSVGKKGKSADASLESALRSSFSEDYLYD